MLRIQWLLSLGPVLWDFGKLQMQFNFKDKGVCLKGLSSSYSSLIDDGEIHWISGIEHKGLLLQMILVQSPEVTTKQV